MLCRDAAQHQPGLPRLRILRSAGPLIASTYFFKGENATTFDTVQVYLSVSGLWVFLNVLTLCHVGYRRRFGMLSCGDLPQTMFCRGARRFLHGELSCRPGPLARKPHVRLLPTHIYGRAFRRRGALALRFC